MSKVTAYSKAIVAVLGAVITVVQAAATDGEITSEEWWRIGIALIVAAGVYLARNTPTVPPAPPAP